MLLDAALLALLAAASAAGALAGLVRPAFLFAGAALGWLAARSLSPAVGRMLVAVVPEAAARPAAAVLLFVAVSGAVSFVGWRISRNREGEGRPLDRAAGALLAGLAAAAAIWVGLAVAEGVAPALPEGWQRALARSDLAGLVRENDLLGGWRRKAESALSSLLRVAGDPGTSARLASDPELRRLLEDPRVRAVLEESRAAGKAAAASPDALRLLSDPDFRARLEAAQERLDRNGAGR